MNKPPVIFDCDGVLLDWETGFRMWVEATYPDRFEFTSDEPESWELASWIGCDDEQAFSLIQQFNRTSAFGRLLPSPYAARALYEVRHLDRPIYVMTSCSSDPDVLRRRSQNLADLFTTPIERVICLDLGVSKLDTLKAFYTVFGECIWIEDNFKNAMAGVEAGHRSFFLHRPHNQADWDKESQSLKHLDHLSDLVSLIK